MSEFEKTRRMGSAIGFGAALMGIYALGSDSWLWVHHPKRDRILKEDASA